MSSTDPALLAILAQLTGLTESAKRSEALAEASKAAIEAQAKII